MSEAELHLLTPRMTAGRTAKAARGELGMAPPVGSVRRPSGDVLKDPDAQARAVVETVFAQFAQRGTVHGVLCDRVEHDLQMPVRVRRGAAKGDLRWSRPTRMTLQNLLANPIDAGADVWGRRPTDPRAKKPGRPTTGRKVAHLGEWRVGLRDRLPAYSSWACFAATRQPRALNRQVARGTARDGAARRAGLVRCGRCGHRRVAQYGSGHPRYCCAAALTTYAGTLCQSLAARSLDAAVATLWLRAREPAALELGLAVATDLAAERARRETLWQPRLERAQFEVDRSRRQYTAVEPENRRVARGLERQLAEHRAAQLRLREDHARHQAARPAAGTPEERAAIRRRAADLPALWRAPTTTIAPPQTLVRPLVEDVRVTVGGASERVTLVVTWVGGHRADATAVRPVGRLAHLSYYPALAARARARCADGRTHAQLAAQLNAEGWRPAKRRATFTASTVSALRERTRSRPPRPTARAGAAAKPRRHEWTRLALATELAMPAITLYTWLQRGGVKARKGAAARPGGRWWVWADAREIVRVRALRTQPRTRWPRVPRPPTPCAPRAVPAAPLVLDRPCYAASATHVSAEFATPCGREPRRGRR